MGAFSGRRLAGLGGSGGVPGGADLDGSYPDPCRELFQARGLFHPSPGMDVTSVPNQKLTGEDGTFEVSRRGGFGGEGRGAVPTRELPSLLPGPASHPAHQPIRPPTRSHRAQRCFSLSLFVGCGHRGLCSGAPQASQRPCPGGLAPPPTPGPLPCHSHSARLPTHRLPLFPDLPRCLPTPHQCSVSLSCLP